MGMMTHCLGSVQPIFSGGISAGQFQKPQSLTLNEDSSERLGDLGKTQLWYEKRIRTELGEKRVRFPFLFSWFLGALIKGLEVKGMKVEEFYHNGGVANHIQGFLETYRCIGLVIKVSTSQQYGGIQEARAALLDLLCTLSLFAVTPAELLADDGLENCYMTHDHSYAVVTLGTSPVRVNITVALDDSALEPCITSAESLQIVGNQEGCWSLRTAEGYDLERTMQLLLEERFEVAFPEKAHLLYHGLFRYTEQCMKGRLPIWGGVEALFCEGFIQHYADPGSLEGSVRFIKGVRSQLAGYTEMEKQAFLFTLENILSRSKILEEEKKTYRAILHQVILPDWEAKKHTFVTEACKEDRKGLDDSEDSLLPPRYQLKVEDACFYGELPLSFLQELLAKNTKENVQIVYRTLEKSKDIPVSLLMQAIVAALKFKMVQPARDLFRLHFAILMTLENAEWTSLIKALPDDPLGLKKAAPEFVVQHAVEFGIHKEWSTIIKEKLLAASDPDPRHVAWITDRLPADPKLKPCLVRAAREAISQDGDLALQLFQKAKSTMQEMLEYAVQIKSEKGSAFCLQLLASLEGAEFSSADIVAVLQYCVPFAQETVFPHFWKRVELLEGLSLKTKLQLLKALEKDPDIAFLLQAIVSNTFDHEKYLRCFEEIKEKEIVQSRQELLLKMIGEPLSLDSSAALLSSSRPGWKKLGVLQLSDEAFLGWVVKNAFSQDLRAVFTVRFEEIWKKVPGQCGPAYLKMRPGSAYADKILDALTEGDTIKHEIFSTLFEHIPANALPAVFQKARGFCCLDTSLKKTLLGLIAKGQAFKGNPSAEMFTSVCSFFDEMETPPSAMIIEWTKRAAATDILKKEASAYFEKKIAIFHSLSGNELFGILQKISITAVAAESILERVVKEKNKHVKVDLFLHLFDQFKKQPLWLVSSKCLEIFWDEARKGVFPDEQMVSAMRNFLSIKLEDPVLKPLGHQILTVASAVKMKLVSQPLIEGLHAEVRNFVLHAWKTFWDTPLREWEMWKHEGFRSKVEGIRMKLIAEHIEHEAAAEQNPESLECKQQKKASVHSLLQFLRCLHLLQDPEGFDLYDRDLLLMRMSVIQRTHQPRLFSMDALRAFDTRWPRDDRFNEAVSVVTESYFDTLERAGENDAAKIVLLKGVESGILLVPFVGRAYALLLKKSDEINRQDFERDFRTALIKGDYTHRDSIIGFQLRGHP